MPYTAKTQVVGPALANSDFSYPIDRGHLVAATVEIEVTPATEGVAYVTLNLYAERQATNQIIAELASGWAGTRMSVSWSGYLPLEDGMVIGATVLADVQAVARLSVITDDTE